MYRRLFLIYIVFTYPSGGQSNWAGSLFVHYGYAFQPSWSQYGSSVWCNYYGYRRCRPQCGICYRGAISINSIQHSTSGYVSTVPRWLSSECDLFVLWHLCGTAFATILSQVLFLLLTLYDRADILADSGSRVYNCPVSFAAGVWRTFAHRMRCVACGKPSNMARDSCG